ncbi:hypothetical protein H1D32_04980 [Anaerobacillus sp. CMMVII]|uniref:hypothetical protein n=1 Tax=Anaerobacillus sp. CMMVII TaxID=2755588 RepID=UPI0021B84C60|nr:hypothetical protein [Anaerobacillus sp. CMMVII]MCT8137151.1 hypothetical protein [Anaerobacillus sp. CMMVII]
MMVLGIFLEYQKGTGIAGVSQGVLVILPLLCLVILTPLLSVPIKLDGYFEAVNVLLRKLIYQPRKLFAGITSSLFILSPILSLGSVRIIHEFLTELKLPPAVYAKSYLVGFSTAIMWSPYFGSVSLVLYYLEMPVGQYILYGIGLAFVSLIVGNIMFALWTKKNQLVQEEHLKVPIGSNHQKQLIKLALFVAGLIIISLVIEFVTKWSMLVIVSLISIAFPIVWGITTNGWKRLYPQWKAFKDISVPALNNEIMLFTSAGLLGHAIQGTNFAIKLSGYLTMVANKSVLLFILFVMGIVLIFTYIGIHQIAVIAALAMQLDPHQLGISTLSLAILLLLSWSISTVLSPFSGLNLMVSRFLGWSGVQVGLRANGAHLTILSVIGIFIILVTL